MRDQWAGFQDLDKPDEDEWAGFEAASPTPPATPSPRPAKAPAKRRGLIGSRAPAPNITFTNPTATDGDTLRDGETRIRLQGIDAPELAQRGWKADGTMVPLGELSRSYLGEQLYSPENMRLVSQAGMSFDRIVGPVENDGGDLGLSSLRAGQSFAAPDYITDPEMRFNYLEAQRLAERNRLGVHGTVTASPSKFRANPDYVPERRETALFADKPTPHSGLSAEKEQEWLGLLHTGTSAEIEAFAKDNGYQIDEERNREWVKRRDEYARKNGTTEGYVNNRVFYTQGTRELIDPEDGQVGAAARQFSGGFLAGALDELGAGVDTLGLSPGRENLFNSDRRFGDIYWNNLAQNQAILAHDRSRYPGTSTTAQIAGGLTSGFALPYARGLATAPQLARYGAGYGGMTGFLDTDGGLADRSVGAIKGATIGTVLDPALGKALDAAIPAASRLVDSYRGRNVATPSQAPSTIPQTIDEIDPALVSEVAKASPLTTPRTRAELLASSANIRPADVLSLPSNVPHAGEVAEQVGNIDVTKLDSPQDIRRALATAHNTVGGFDASTRGRISHGETERLAEELGMTADDLLSRRNGQAFNAEEALAARQILAKSGNELVNAARRIQRQETPSADDLAAFREGLVRHTAIQEQVSGITAEAGRTLQQFRQAANSRAVTDQVLNAFVRSGGGEGGLKDAADLLIEASELGPGQFATTARRVNEPKFKEKIGELYINALLSNPPTHVVNMVSNALTTVAQIPEFAVASGLGAARRAAFGAESGERILGSEVGARAFGLLQGTREGLGLFAKALRTGEADDFVSKVEGDQFRAISGLKGEIARIPTRFLTAEDQLFKGIARRMELNAQAVREAHKEGLTGQARTDRIAELVANPTDEMLERSFDYGLYLTFQKQLGSFGRRVSGATSDSLAAKIIVPFVRTPINLLKFATERSPAAPLLSEWRKDFRAGGEARDLAVARSILGTGIAYSFYDLARQGLITGSAPSDPSKARLMYADGWQPYSLKVGDRYISYSRLDPLSTTLGVAADMATLPEGMSDRQREDQSTMLVASIMSNLASKTWLSGVSSLTAGLADPQRNAENWLERTVSSFATPAVMGGAARQLDPIVRQREGVGEAIQSRVPGLSDELLPARNVFGEPRETDSLGPDFISPFWQSKDKSDPVVAEMLRIQKSVSAPGKQFTEDGERIDYPRETYDRYHEIAGRLTYNNLLALIGSQRYSNLDDTGKRNASKKAIRDAREAARAVLADPDYPLPSRGAGASDTFQEYLADDPFAGFPGEGGADPWAGFPGASGQP